MGDHYQADINFSRPNCEKQQNMNSQYETDKKDGCDSCDPFV